MDIHGASGGNRVNALLDRGESVHQVHLRRTGTVGILPCNGIGKIVIHPDHARRGVQLADQHHIIAAAATVEDSETLACKRQHRALWQARERPGDGVRTVVVDEREAVAKTIRPREIQNQRCTPKIDCADNVDTVICTARDQAAKIGCDGRISRQGKRQSIDNSSARSRRNAAAFHAHLAVY